MSVLVLYLFLSGLVLLSVLAWFGVVRLCLVWCAVGLFRVISRVGVYFRQWVSVFVCLCLLWCGLGMFGVLWCIWVRLCLICGSALVVVVFDLAYSGPFVPVFMILHHFQVCLWLVLCSRLCLCECLFLLWCDLVWCCLSVSVLVCLSVCVYSGQLVSVGACLSLLLCLCLFRCVSVCSGVCSCLFGSALGLFWCLVVCSL